MGSMRLHPFYSAAALLLAAAGAHGAGFGIIENSASGMGTAYASGGAAGEDASTVWFNPASMTLLKGQNVVGAINAIFPTADFSNNGSTFADGTALSGPDSSSNTPALIPTFYYSGQISEQLFAGISINAPFGLVTQYDDDWVGRYHAVESDLKTVNINPAVAYKIDDRLSIGAGVSLQLLDITLTSAVDFGALLGTPGSADGFAKLTGDNYNDLAFGWNVGMLYNVDEHTRIALAYRSAIDQHVEGDADFRVPAAAAPIVSTGAFTDTTLSADVTLPASASLSLFHSFGVLDLMADVTWTQWSTFEELRIKYDNPAQPDSVTTEDYQDQWRVAVGERIHISEKLVLRTGIAYDQKAVKNRYRRTPRIPDNDRFWLSVGAGYAISSMLSIDAAYSHLFVATTKIENTFESGLPELNHTLKGTYSSSVDILSAQLSMKF
ncbi:outer membrane protein transport protein [Sulfurimonas sp. HSL1-2]|uniref:OmpP1/FadL family transporter n=1 Tax=Thiomicrolovo zhangzhouensis TaxID=3131933 RepID=UPI0031F8AADD